MNILSREGTPIQTNSNVVSLWDYNSQKTTGKPVGRLLLVRRPVGYNEYEKSFQEQSVVKERSDMTEELFEKYLDQRFANIDDKISNIKEENRQLREDFRNAVADIKAAVQQQTEETRNLVNLISSEVKDIRSEIRDIRAEIRGTNKWIIGLVIAAIVGIAGLVGSSIWALFAKGI